MSCYGHVALFWVALAATANAASGGAPLTMTHSGYLLDTSDNPVSSTLAMKFRISDAQGFGNVQWEGTCASVPVVRGYYTVVLGSDQCVGSANGLDPLLDTSDLPTAAVRWLEAEVGGVTLSPRMAISTVPTAAVASRALTADLLGTHAASDFALVSSLAGVATSGAYSALTGTPTLGALAAKGSIADADVASSAAIAASKIAGLAPVATGGAYSDLTGTPTLGALAAKGSIVDADVAGGAAIAVSKITGLAPVATSGSYNDLTNKPAVAVADLMVLAGITRPCNSGTAYEVFNGSTFGPCIVNAGAFTLTAVTGAALNSVVTSNTLTPTGFSGAGTLTLTGGSGFEIVKNGTPTGQTVVTVTTSDTFAVRTTTGSVNSVTTSVTATLGTASSTWSVTTTPPLWNCTTAPTHDGCASGSTTYASCKAIKDDSTFTGGNGTYYVDPDGVTATFSSMAVWCDMANGGWTLIQSHVANGSTTQGVTVGSASGSYLPLSTMQAFANSSSSVRIVQRSGSLYVESADSYPITRLRAGSNVDDDATKNASHFTGTGTGNLAYGCTGNYAWPSVYWACGNGGGLHILPTGTTQASTHGFTNNSEDLDVLVK